MAGGATVLAMLDNQVFVGFGAGFLLVLAILVGAILLARAMVGPAAPSNPTLDEDLVFRIRGWRLAGMIALLALKTFGIGICIYLVVVVWCLPLLAFGAGLFSGLGAVVAAASIVHLIRPKKKTKNN